MAPQRTEETSIQLTRVARIVKKIFPPFVEFEALLPASQGSISWTR